MAERFVSESIAPASDAIDTTGMSRGEPGLPTAFTWRGTEYPVAEVIESWKERGAKFGEGEMYTRKHWYKLRTGSGAVMTVYFERQARSRGAAKTRWWLYTLDVPE